jgi:hypothetical protein
MTSSAAFDDGTQGGIGFGRHCHLGVEGDDLAASPPMQVKGGGEDITDIHRHTQHAGTDRGGWGGGGHGASASGNESMHLHHLGPPPVQGVIHHHIDRLMDIARGELWLRRSHREVRCNPGPHLIHPFTGTGGGMAIG